MTRAEAIEAANKFFDALDAAARAGREAMSAVVSSVTESSSIDKKDKLLWTIEDVVLRYPVTTRMVLAAHHKGLLPGEPAGGSRRLMFEPAAVQAWVRNRVSRSALRAVR
jgi:hypothetical protein